VTVKHTDTQITTTRPQLTTNVHHSNKMASFMSSHTSGHVVWWISQLA